MGGSLIWQEMHILTLPRPPPARISPVLPVRLARRRTPGVNEGCPVHWSVAGYNQRSGEGRIPLQCSAATPDGCLQWCCSWWL